MTPEQRKIRALEQQIIRMRATEAALLAKLTSEPFEADNVTRQKLRELLAAGRRVVGWVLQRGDEIAIQYGAAVRWKTPQTMWHTMHGPDTHQRWVRISELRKFWTPGRAVQPPWTTDHVELVDAIQRHLAREWGVILTGTPATQTTDPTHD